MKVFLLILGLLVCVGIGCNSASSTKWQEGHLVNGKCPFCIAEGKQSRVYEIKEYTPYRFLEWEETKAYWDSMGVYQYAEYHGLKKSWRKFKCSEGHHFQTTTWERF